jgi:UDP-glucose 4-epimerase
MALNPMTPYALQKLTSELYGQMFTRLYGFEAVTTRYFNVFGPRQDPGSPYSGVISLFIKALAEGSRPVIYGDGEQTRDFTFVSNVVDGVIRAAETPGVGGEVFNVATNSRISLNHLLATLKKIFNSNVEPIYKEGRKGDVKDSQADIKKAERLLGYKPTVGLEDGLRETVKWFTEG